MSGEPDGPAALAVQTQRSQLPQDGYRISRTRQEVAYLSSAGLRALLLLSRQTANRNGQLVTAALSEELIDTRSETGFLPCLVTGPSLAEVQQPLGEHDGCVNRI